MAVCDRRHARLKVSYEERLGTAIENAMLMLERRKIDTRKCVKRAFGDGASGLCVPWPERLVWVAMLFGPSAWEYHSQRDSFHEFLRWVASTVRESREGGGFDESHVRFEFVFMTRAAKRDAEKERLRREVPGIAVSDVEFWEHTELACDPYAHQYAPISAEVLSDERRAAVCRAYVPDAANPGMFRLEKIPRFDSNSREVRYFAMRLGGVLEAVSSITNVFQTTYNVYLPTPSEVSALVARNPSRLPLSSPPPPPPPPVPSPPSSPSGGEAKTSRK